MAERETGAETIEKIQTLERALARRLEQTDAEARRIIQQAQEQAGALIRDRRDALNALLAAEPAPPESPPAHGPAPLDESRRAMIRDLAGRVFESFLRESGGVSS